MTSYHRVMIRSNCFKSGREFYNLAGRSLHNSYIILQYIFSYRAPVRLHDLPSSVLVTLQPLMLHSLNYKL